MNENVKIEPIENGFKASIEIPKKIIDLELNEYLNRINEINRLIITDKNELYTRELLNRIDKAIELINLELSQRQSNISLHTQVLLIEIKSILERGKE